MLDPADVLVDAALTPVRHALVDHRPIVVRAAVAQEIPRRLDEGIHGIRLAPRRLAALGTGTLIELGHLGERTTGARHRHVFRQHNRQLIVRYRDVAARRTMDDRNRAAPVTLAGNAPVAQAELHFLAPQTQRGEIGRDGIDGLFIAESRVFPRADAIAVLGAVPFLPCGVGENGFLAVDRQADRLHDRNAVFLGKGEIAFVVRWHRHHRTVAVAHQNIIAHPDFDLLAGQRVCDEDTRRHPLLFHGGEIRLRHAALLAFVHEGSQFRIIPGSVSRQRMFRRHGNKGHAHDRIGARGEHPQLFRLAIQLIRKGKAHAFALADPVLLHQLDLLWPARHLIKIGQ